MPVGREFERRLRDGGRGCLDALARLIDEICLARPDDDGREESDRIGRVEDFRRESGAVLRLRDADHVGQGKVGTPTAAAQPESTLVHRRDAARDASFT